MKQILLILTIILLTLNDYGQGQKKLDSLLAVLKIAKEDTSKVNTLNSISKEKIDNGKIQEGRKYAVEALTLAEKLDYKKGIALSYRRIGYIHNQLSEYPKALEYYQKGLSVNEQLGDKANIAWFLNSMGTIYKDLSDFPKALEYYQKALTVNEQSSDKNGIAVNLSGIGVVYNNLSDCPKALVYEQKALAIFEQLDDKKNATGLLNNIGVIYMDLKDYPKALEYYNKALIINEQLNNKTWIATNLVNIGLVYECLTDYANALQYEQKALKIDEEIGNQFLMASANSDIGVVYRKQGKLNEALKYESKGLAIALKIGAKKKIKEAYGDLSILDSAMGDFRGAYENHKLYMQYNDSIFNFEKDKRITALAMKYDFAKVQDSTKSEQARKDAVATKEVQKQRLVRNGFIGGFSIVLLFSIVVYRQRNRIAGQRNRIEAEKNRSEELLLNILPAEVAEELKDTGHSKGKSFEQVTVMFTDFKGFTQISEKLGAEKTVAEIDYCFSAFDKIIHKHHIEKNKDHWRCLHVCWGLTKSKFYPCRRCGKGGNRDS